MKKIALIILIFLISLNIVYADEAVNIDTDISFWDRVRDPFTQPFVIVAAGTEKSYKAGDTVKLAYSDHVIDNCANPYITVKIVRLSFKSKRLGESFTKYLSNFNENW